MRPEEAVLDVGKIRLHLVGGKRDAMECAVDPRVAFSVRRHRPSARQQRDDHHEAAHDQKCRRERHRQHAIERQPSEAVDEPQHAGGQQRGSREACRQRQERLEQGDGVRLQRRFLLIV